MNRSKKCRIGLYALILALPASWLISEFRWSFINNPTNKFDSIETYVANGRLPSRIKTIDIDGRQHFIAFSPMDVWLAVPSGPAAYVFDPSGKMIDWSRDTGDDPEFRKRWPNANHVDSTIEEMKKRFQQDP